MNDEKKYTERDLVMAKREGLRVGLLGEAKQRGNDELEILAKHYFPLPVRVVPRVVDDPEPDYDQQWRVVNGRLQYSPWRGEWSDAEPKNNVGSRTATCMTMTPKRVAMWADLFANPTTTEEDA